MAFLAAPAPSEVRALHRMRRYILISFELLLLFTGVLVAGALPNWSQLIPCIVVVLILGWQLWYWERGAPVWLNALAVAASYALWIWAVVERSGAPMVLLPAFAIALIVSIRRSHRNWWLLGGVAVLVAPIPVANALDPNYEWNPWYSAAIFASLGVFAMFVVNDYSFRLYLELDAARRTSAELAVAEERYRFATDLHDIQGHTLHVIKLKTQLAQKLIERDPAAAREQLREAEELIVETLANTRSLAFGDREVATSSELANAKELFLAADVAWTQAGEVTAGTSDELFALVVRETTTNILRHSQATAVSVTLSPTTITITNDGSPSSSRPPSGLARLGERFEAAGGELTTSNRDGVFTTKAKIS